MFSKLAIVLVSILLSNIHCDSYDKVLHFPEFSTEDYVLLRPDFSRVQDEISVCSWVKKIKDNSANDHWFSYATSTTNWEFTIADYLSQVQLFGGSYTSSAGVTNSLSEWQHCCVTWSYTRQILKLYVNGNLERSVEPTTSRKIGTGGTLVLGQEQDVEGGGFGLSESFAGEIYQLNVFDRSLSDKEIETMFKNGRCSYLDHSLLEYLVLGWEDVLEGSRHGAVSIVTSECTSGWNILNDFLGRPVTEKLINYLKQNHVTHNHCRSSRKILHFPEEFSTENYVLIRPNFSKVQDKITICSWIKKIKDNVDISSWFSYATSTSDNELVFYDYLSPAFLFSENRADAGVNGPLNEWQHCCVTWSSSEDNLKIYMNGALEVSVLTSTSGRKIGRNGTLVLGQVQDVEGGGFDIRNSFAGDVYQLNVFDRPLTDEEIQTMFQNGMPSSLDYYLLQHVVLGWKDVLEGYRHGAVSVVTSGCNQWDILNNFRGWGVTEKLIDRLKKDDLLNY